jgi:histone deacetylase complex regulatory component SIN3
MNILSTIHSKYQGETMFCFVCVATVFGYILGVNRVIDAIISKHSDETRVKVIKTLNKYTQTNFDEIAELLASNNLILSPNGVVDDVSSSSVQGDNNTNDSANDGTNKTSANLNSEEKKEKKEDQEKQVQENTIMSPSSTLSVSTSEEDYELVRKNENVNHLKNKNSVNYFEWLNIF